MTAHVEVVAVAADTNVAFKNCAPFTRCVTHINDEHVEAAKNLDIIMPMYKESLLGKATDAGGNDRSLKKCKYSNAFKIFK